MDARGEAEAGGNSRAFHSSSPSFSIPSTFPPNILRRSRLPSNPPRHLLAPSRTIRFVPRENKKIEKEKNCNRDKGKAKEVASITLSEGKERQVTLAHSCRHRPHVRQSPPTPSGHCHRHESSQTFKDTRPCFSVPTLLLAHH
ncbi:hypothetical protein E2C01_003793 [Portunus trituberculatus]|uniref:Uncharacterized protein n=1 Tax=Portunus trituberculatus TaxID=210409 RepID=A0A5B7CPK8_PORTR|nr:hypothetical protein [Portunus trituberculatus]